MMRTTIRLMIGFTCLSFLDVTNAGSMGDVHSGSLSYRGILPFASIEAFPVWVAYGNVTYSQPGYASTTKRTALSGGGRVAAGFAYPYTANIDLTAEAGWNYFGQKSIKTYYNTFGNSVSLSGVDSLVGFAIKKNNFECFLKAGALFQVTSYNIAYINSSTSPSYNLHWNGVISDILPEVKVGSTYNINKNWGVSLAFMHAFGTSPQLNIAAISTSAGQSYNIVADMNGPSLNAIQIGARYQFAN